MFSGLLNPLRRNIGVRLSLWYALIFTFSGLALLAFAYYMLAAAVGSKDREVLEARWKEVAAIYDAGGTGALRQWWENQPSPVQHTLLLRVVNVFGEVAFVRWPEDWVSFRDLPIGREGLRWTVGVIRVPQNAERDFLLAVHVRPQYRRDGN